VKCCVRNFSNLAYCKVISRCRHRGFSLRSSTPSTSTILYAHSPKQFWPTLRIKIAGRKEWASICIFKPAEHIAGHGMLVLTVLLCLWLFG